MFRYTINNIEHEFSVMHPVGEKVLLKKLISSGPDKKCGDILIPHEVNKNSSLGVAEVIELGNSDQCRDSGLHEGDFVLYDYYSVFNDGPEYVITNIENIIMQLTPDEANNFIETSCIF